jgi:hypothetical protein
MHRQVRRALQALRTGAVKPSEVISDFVPFQIGIPGPATYGASLMAVLVKAPGTLRHGDLHDGLNGVCGKQATKAVDTEGST